jgi:hypothetical protein
MVKKKLNFWKMPAALLALVMVCGCTSMMPSRWDNNTVAIGSQTNGIEFEILDGNKVVASGVTPGMVELTAKSFNGAYTIKFKTPDGREIQQELKGSCETPPWYNLWWLAGLNYAGLGFIVDAATGCIYQMPPNVLLKEISYNSNSDSSIMIASIDEVRPEMRPYLIPQEN